MRELRFWAMGCQMAVLLEAEGPAAQTVLEAVPEWFATWENVLSRFRADSELTKLNQHSGHWTQVSHVLAEVLRVALEMAESSDGLVTPTILTALEAAGYTHPYEIMQRAGADLATPSGEDGSAAPAPDWRAIRIEGDWVALPAGVRVDLGGVAKGWAAEQVANRLAEFGPCLVDAGGDIVVRGPRRDGEPWVIGVMDPMARDQDLALLALEQGAVATSGRDYRRWLRSGRHFHHLIDPRTGRPAETDVLTATAFAPTGPEAEMAAKVMLLLGSDQGLSWIEQRPRYAGLVVLEHGEPRVRFSSRMHPLLLAPA